MVSNQATTVQDPSVPVRGIWLAASKQLGRDVSTHEPYPCLCQPRRGSICSGWKGCPCYQRISESHLPGGCCGPRTHQAMLDTQAAAIAAELGMPTAPRSPLVTSPLVPGSERTEPTLRVSPARHEIPEQHMSPGVRTPYERRWPPEALTCLCSTPWDGQTTRLGYHCVGCCRNFVNYSVGFIHKRRWSDPCRDPTEIKDCDTGRALFQLRSVNGFPVWGWAAPH